MRTKTTELWRSGSFAGGSFACYSVKEGSLYVTLYYKTIIQGDRDESWSWPLDQSERLLKTIERMEEWMPGVLNAMPKPCKHYQSRPIK